MELKIDLIIIIISSELRKEDREVKQFDCLFQLTERKYANLKAEIWSLKRKLFSNFVLRQQQHKQQQQQLIRKQQHQQQYKPQNQSHLN